MKIALIAPRSTFIESPMTWQPLGLLYLAARLESLGHETELFDLNEDSLPPDGAYDQLWVSATAPQMAEIKRIARETASYKTKRVLGGASVWANPDSCRNLGYALIVGGEADAESSVKTILELADNPPPDHYILFPVSRTLDWVLPPIRRWSHRYHSYVKGADGNQYRMSSLFTARGCPMLCSFCESGRLGVIWDARTRYEPLDIVEQQIRECAEQGYHLGYYDDIMILNRPRTLKLLELHKKYDRKWRGFIRTDIVCKHGGYQFLKELRDGGLIEMFVGVESASNDVKAAIHKGTTIEMDTAVLQWAQELGIRMKCSFILGLPGESRESMEQTRAWILKYRPDRVQCDRLIVFPGTPLGDHPEQYDLTYESRPDDDWFFRGRDDREMHSFVSTSHLTAAEIDAFWHSLERELQAQGIHA